MLKPPLLTQADCEGDLLVVVLGLDAVHVPSGPLEPADHLETSTGAQLGVWNTKLSIYTFLELQCFRNN